MNTIPLTFSIPAYIATNPSTGICNVYDHLPQRLDNGDYAGNIILTLGVKGIGEIPDRINYWSLQGIELPAPGTKPIRISLGLDLSDQAHPIKGAEAGTSVVAVDQGGHYMDCHSQESATKGELHYLYDKELDY